MKHYASINCYLAGMDNPPPCDPHDREMMDLWAKMSNAVDSFERARIRGNNARRRLGMQPL